MSLSITYNNFIPGTTIFASQANTNSADIENWANAHEIATTGVHGVGAGTIVGTANNNTFTGTNIFSGISAFGNAVSMLTPGFISNARLFLNAGVLSLRNESGSVPSAASPTYFRIKTSTGWTTYSFTSNAYSQVADASSASPTQTQGEGFGTVPGTAWPNNMPLFVYVATSNAGTNPCLFLSRLPNALAVPSAANIHYIGTGAQGNIYTFFAMTANNVTASHQNQPCELVGFIHATKNSSNQWTFASMAGGNAGGIGSYIFENAAYTFPTGQNGAAVGSYLGAGGGTLPTYTSQAGTYKMNRFGQVFYSLILSNVAGGTPGAGGFTLYMPHPFSSTAIPNYINGNGRILNGAITFNSGVLMQTIFSSYYVMEFNYNFANALGAGNMQQAGYTIASQNNAVRSLYVTTMAQF